MRTLVSLLGPCQTRLMIDGVTRSNVFRDWKFTTDASEFVPLQLRLDEIPHTKEGKIRLFVERCMVRDNNGKLTFNEIVSHPTFVMLIPTGRRTCLSMIESVLDCNFVLYIVKGWNFRRSTDSMT